MSKAVLYDEILEVPRATRFPVEISPPPGFDPERLETWPEVHGRLEFVDGRLLFMAPCGDEQQYTVADVVISLGAWRRHHTDFVLSTNEAGMRLGNDTRAADAAIWRRSDLGPHTGGLQRTPPLLAVEVAGQDDSESQLRDKAAWYLEHGVEAVWLVLPRTRRVIVMTTKGTVELSSSERIPEHPSLPGLSPMVRELFVQLDED
ncbi:MAG: Uma2 family endonuclease [Myxococcota bacterium]